MEILTAPANLPFTIALAIVVLLGVVEVLGLLIGGASTLSIDGIDADADVELGGGEGDGFLPEVLGWLHVGQMPAAILGIVFLLGFGVMGLGLQSFLHARFGAMLPPTIAVVLALVIALPATRMGGGLLKCVLPRDETEAVSRDSFLGCEAEITIGTSRRGQPAEARLKDRFGRSHYVMVEPDVDGEEFPAGSPVLILKRHGDIYRVMNNRGTSLSEIENGITQAPRSESTFEANEESTTYEARQGAKE